MKFRVNYKECDLGTYDFNAHMVIINMKMIKACCDKFNSDFYTLLLHVINHEMLHYVLHVDHDRIVSRDLDNLTHNKQNDNNIWEYWIS